MVRNIYNKEKKVVSCSEKVLKNYYTIEKVMIIFPAVKNDMYVPSVAVMVK